MGHGSWAAFPTLGPGDWFTHEVLSDHGECYGKGPWIRICEWELPSLRIIGMFFTGHRSHRMRPYCCQEGLISLGMHPAAGMWQP